MEERLQKIIARAGITSRRKAEELILQGRVKVNGKVQVQVNNQDVRTVEQPERPNPPGRPRRSRPRNGRCRPRSYPAR